MAREMINKLILQYRNNFFTEPILLLTLVSCCVIGLLYNNRERERVFFLCYFVMGLLLFSVGTTVDYLRPLAPKDIIKFDEIFNTTFELVEFIAFYYFFKKCLQKKFQQILNVFLSCLIIVITVFFIVLFFSDYTIDKIREHSFFINVIEFFFLALLCLAYFYELFTGTPKRNLFQRPSFFITTSAFFYSVLLIPFFIIARDIWKNERSLFFILFSCHYLLLTILLITIANAFLSRKPITT